MVGLWNRLPEYVVLSTNINEFKKNYDVYYTTTTTDVYDWHAVNKCFSMCAFIYKLYTVFHTKIKCSNVQILKLFNVKLN